MTVVSADGGVATDAALRRRPILWILVLAGLTIAVSVVAVAVGAVAVPVESVVEVIAHRLAGTSSEMPTEDAVVWLIRLPRVIVGVCVGIALSIAGVAIQAIVRNPLADPYLIGVSPGATTGAAASILFGIGGAWGGFALTGSAFVGAVVAIALVFALARVGGRLVSARVVFAGIAVGFALTAVTNLLVFLSDSRDGVRAVMFWMLGSLARADWSQVPLLTSVTALCAVALWSCARGLDTIAIGDDTARSLGTDPTRFRGIVLVIAAVAVAAAVAVSGMIGFIGLVVPHLARRLVGARHVVVLPTAALLGAVVTVAADAVARTVAAPREVPLGILTALLGTPLLILLVRRSLAR
ncbi:FecCD family ABC transporter permease [Microbacterium sp.]|uniref:FecCD family ABC transporter permease n=1 Tax=Microbacterium sp. TaxID=51671 RepID=UPI0039E6BAA3